MINELTLSRPIARLFSPLLVLLCFMLGVYLLNQERKKTRHWGIVTVPGFLHERAKFRSAS